MSTLLHDLASQTVFALGIPPQTVTESGPGDPIELEDGDGPLVLVLQTGDVNTGTTLTLTVEESAGDGEWEAISDAEIDGPLAAQSVSAITFRRSLRLVRCALELDGPDPSAVLSVLIGQQKKVF